MNDGVEETAELGSRTARTLWKVLSIVLATIFLACFLVALSMPFWSGIPSERQPSEGRVYPLNNHGHYNYMNRQEYLLNQWSFWIFPAAFFPGSAIYYFADPFDRKRRWRDVRPLRPW